MNEAFEREVVLFNTALQLAEPERSAYLAEACGPDEALRSRLESLLAAEGAAEGFLGEPVCGGRGAGPEGASASTALAAEQLGDTIGRYKLLQQIGEGGCGVVYMAEQEEPVRRRVALKVIKLGMDTRSVIGRFEAERQALALMDHPNIARVFDAGATDSGRPYFVMELVRGVKITDFCDQNQLPLRERLELFVQVCRAVQHAHQKGIIHRDLKPSNILVTVNDGVPVPKVIDFGIAKATEGRLTDRTVFTAFEQFIGTPAYMSPEQAVMTSVDVDTRSDIYSLGVLLYELLTGRPPFSQAELMAAGVEEMRRTIREREPSRPSTRLSTMGVSDLASIARSRQSEPPGLVHLVRGDLDWIVMKCLEKERARRYETANGLAMDVQRFLASEPIVARPPSRVYRLRKMVARNQVAVVAGLAVVLALCVGLGVSTWQYVQKSRAEREQSRLREQAQRAQASEARSRRQAEAQELAARRKAYASDMNLLQRALAVDDLGRAQELLDRQRPRHGEADLRGWEWRYFWQFCQSDAAFTLCQRSNSVVTVSFSGDGSLLGVATWDGEVTVWDVAGRRMVFQAQPAGGYAGRLAFAPQGGVMVYYDVSGEVPSAVVWDGSRRKEVRRLPLNGPLRDLAFVSGGRVFTASWAQTNNIVLWELESGKVLARFSAIFPRYSNGTLFAAAEDGSCFAHVLDAGPDKVRVVEVVTGRERRFRVADELTTALAFDPSGKWLFTGAGYADGTVRAWDVATGQSAGSLEGHRSWVGCLKSLRDGRTLVSASADRTVRLWDREGRRSTRTLRGRSGELWTVDQSPDGRWLVSGGKDGSVVFWDLTSATNRPALHRVLQADRRGCWEYAADGRWMGVTQGGRVGIRDARSWELVAEPGLGMTNVVRIVFSPDARLLVATDRAANLGVWDLVEKRLVTRFIAHPGAVVWEMRFTPDGRSLVTRAADNTFRRWEVATWNVTSEWSVNNGADAWSICPDGERVLSATPAGSIELLVPGRPELRKVFSGQPRIVALASSADGRILSAASENGTLELWDLERSEQLGLLQGVLLGYHSTAVSPDGERVAAGSNGQEAIKVWDLRSREEVATLAGQGSFFADLKFSPDGNTLSARNWNGMIHFWTAPSWGDIETAERAGRMAAASVGE